MRIAFCLFALLLSGTCSINSDGSVVLPDMTCDQPYSTQLSTAYTYSNIPPGLVLNPTTGVLSGTVKCTDIGMPVPSASVPDPTVNLTMYYTAKAK